MTGTLDADVVVIGAGPTGAAATWRIATAGLSVTCPSAPAPMRPCPGVSATMLPFQSASIMSLA